MSRVISDPGRVVEGMLKGLFYAHPKLTASPDNPRVIKRRSAPQADKRSRPLGCRPGPAR